MSEKFDFINNLTLEDREYLSQTAALLQLVGTPCPNNWEEWAYKTLQEKKEAEEKTRLEQERKETKKRQKAEALNMTYEQYEEYRKRQQRISRYKSEIRKCEQQIIQAQKDMAYWKTKLQNAEEEQRNGV